MLRRQRCGEAYGWEMISYGRMQYVVWALSSLGTGLGQDRPLGSHPDTRHPLTWQILCVGASPQRVSTGVSLTLATHQWICWINSSFGPDQFMLTFIITRWQYSILSQITVSNFGKITFAWYPSQNWPAFTTAGREFQYCGWMAHDSCWDIACQERNTEFISPLGTPCIFNWWKH